MDRLAKSFLLFLTLALLLFAQPAGVPYARAQIDPAACALLLDQMERDIDWRSELRDPVIHSAAELSQWVDRYRPVRVCLLSGGIPITGERADLRELSGLFLALAGDFLLPEDMRGAGQGVMLPFAEVQDPAVLALRDEAGVPPPLGFVYIWMYPSREAMPPLLQGFFEREDVRGVTVLSRYIIVIDPLAASGGSPAELREWQRDQRSRTLSHELVHAYVKASLGPPRAFSLPLWYDEGLAIYLSGSSEPSAVAYNDESGRVIAWTAAPQDYARYRDLFAYLEQQYGRERLMALIGQSLAQNDPALLYRELGAINESELYAMAETQRVRRSLTRIAIFAGIPLTALLLLAFFKLLLPPVRELYPGLGLPSIRLGRRMTPDDVIWMKTRSDLRGLARMLNYSDPSRPQEAVYIRFSAAESLHELARPESVDLLIGALKDENSVVRAAAARALGDLVNQQNRGRILAALFPCFEDEQTNEVRWAAAEAIYRAGGEIVIRPMLSVIRRWLRRPGSSDSQDWFVAWAAGNHLYGAMIDLYPWLEPADRLAVVERLQGELSPPLLARLQAGCATGDPDLRELAEYVLGGCQG
jgi:hypothetical protein